MRSEKRTAATAKVVVWDCRND